MYETRFTIGSPLETIYFQEGMRFTFEEDLHAFVEGLSNWLEENSNRHDRYQLQIYYPISDLTRPNETRVWGWSHGINTWLYLGNV